MKNKKKHIVTCGIIVFLFALFATLCYFGPKKEYSISERRLLAKFPTLNAQTILSGAFMNQFETYAADTFPFREGFRTIKSATTVVSGQKTNNDIYLYDGHLSKLEYPLDTDSIDHAIGRFESIYTSLLMDATTNVYISVIPDKNAALADNANQLSMDYDAFESYVMEKASFANYIRISDMLSAEDYYYTDSHWRQEQIVDVADHLLHVMDASLSQDDAQLTSNQVPDTFYGVYHGQFALPIKGDTMYYLTSPVIDQLIAYDHEHGQPIPVYDLEKTTDKDPYEMYLSGPLSLITIENPMAKENGIDKELIIFRDSFASSLAPLLANGYSKVTLVDIRYLPSSQIGKYVSFDEADVLFLYSTSVLNNSETLK